MNPPTAGPMIDAEAKTEPIRPCHRPRSLGGTIAPITASDSESRPPAPSPWTPRASTSSVISCAAPQSADPTRKMAIATRNSGRRP